MSARPSKAHEQAKLAFEKSGFTMTALELSQKFKIAPSNIYRAPWWKNRPAASTQPQTGEK